MILYKYCPWNKNTRENIAKNQIFPNRSINENDPFDNLPAFNHLEWAYEISRIKKLNLKIVLNNINNYFAQYVEMIKRITFIISLSSINDDILMWSHYADKHKGVCIEYDISGCKFEEGIPRFQKVSYEDNRVQWPARFFGITKNKLFNDKELLLIVNKTMMTKSKHWEYENEYRSVFMNENNEEDNIEKDAKIKAVYIGCNVDEKTANEIKEYVYKQDKRIKIYRAVPHQNEFKLKMVPF